MASYRNLYKVDLDQIEAQLSRQACSKAEIRKTLTDHILIKFQQHTHCNLNDENGTNVRHFITFEDLDPNSVLHQPAIEAQQAGTLLSLDHFYQIFAAMSHLDKKTVDLDKLCLPRQSRIDAIYQELMNPGTTDPPLGFAGDKPTWKHDVKRHYEIHGGVVHIKRIGGSQNQIVLERAYQYIATNHVKIHGSSGSVVHLSRDETLKRIRKDQSTDGNETFTTQIVKDFISNCPGCQGKATVVARRQGIVTTRANGGNTGTKPNGKRRIEGQVGGNAELNSSPPPEGPRISGPGIMGNANTSDSGYRPDSSYRPDSGYGSESCYRPHSGYVPYNGYGLQFSSSQQTGPQLQYVAPTYDYNRSPLDGNSKSGHYDPNLQLRDWPLLSNDQLSFTLGSQGPQFSSSQQVGQDLPYNELILDDYQLPSNANSNSDLSDQNWRSGVYLQDRSSHLPFDLSGYEPQSSSSSQEIGQHLLYDRPIFDNSQFPVDAISNSGQFDQSSQLEVYPQHSSNHLHFNLNDAEPQSFSSSQQMGQQLLHNELISDNNQSMSNGNFEDPDLSDPVYRLLGYQPPVNDPEPEHNPGAGKINSWTELDHRAFIQGEYRRIMGEEI